MENSEKKNTSFRGRDDVEWAAHMYVLAFCIVERLSSPNESCDFLQRLLCPLETLKAAAPRRDAQQPMPKLFTNLQGELELIR